MLSSCGFVHEVEGLKSVAYFDLNLAGVFEILAFLN